MYFFLKSILITLLEIIFALWVSTARKGFWYLNSYQTLPWFRWHFLTISHHGMMIEKFTFRSLEMLLCLLLSKCLNVVHHEVVVLVCSFIWNSFPFNWGWNTLKRNEFYCVFQMAPDYDHLTLMEKVEVFEHAVNNTAGDDLAKLLWLKSPSSEVWCSASLLC